jgi:predicted metal-dependent hydrolase
MINVRSLVVERILKLSKATTPVTDQKNSNAEFEQGIALFNARDFFQAHEVWEDVWRVTSLPEKKKLQGMIQIAVAMHHYSTGNREGAESVMARALRNLEGAEPAFRGVDMVRLNAELARVLRELRSSGSVAPFQLERG